MVLNYNKYYLIKIKNFTTDMMIKYEDKAAEIQDEYYKLLIGVGNGTKDHLNFRNFHSKVLKIINKNDKVSAKN